MVLTKARIGLIVAVVTAVVVVLQAFDIFEISDAQAALVAAEVSSFLVLVATVMAHFKPGTKQEFVGIAGGVTAFSTATVASLQGLEVVHWTPNQVAAVLGCVVVVVSLWTNWQARDEVTAERTPDA